MSLFLRTKVSWRLYRNLRKYVDDDGKPVRCPFCESTDIIEHVQVIDSGVVSEFAIACNDIECGTHLGYFAYGYYAHTNPLKLSDVIKAFGYDLVDILRFRSNWC